MMKLKKKPAFLLMVTFLWVLQSASLPGETRVYEEREGDRVTTHRFVIESSGSGFNVELTSETGKGKIYQTFQLDAGLAAFSWSYDAPFKKTKVTAVRKENTIFLEGTDEGDPVKKTFRINALPWNQGFNIGLEHFALSSEKSMTFWAIGTSGPGNMKITKFKVKKKDDEIVTLGLTGQKVEAVYMTISLTGLLSLFWTGKYWFRKSDGWFLKYKGKNKSGGPVAVMELTSMLPAPPCAALGISYVTKIISSRNVIGCTGCGVEKRV